MQNSEFKQLYDAVFDEDGNTKACGRDACIALIRYCEEMYFCDVGDITTGFMKVDVIKKLYQNFQKYGVR